MEGQVLDPMDLGDDDGATAIPRVVPTDAAEFSALYEREFLPAARLAALLCSDRESALDITQDAFVALHRKWETVRDPRAYVRRSIVNGSRSWLRKRRTRDRTPLPAPDDVVQSPDELSDVLAHLPSRQRAAIVLRYHHQCSHDEIAEAIGCRTGTVGSLLSRALTTLRKELS